MVSISKTPHNLVISLLLAVLATWSFCAESHAGRKNRSKAAKSAVADAAATPTLLRYMPNECTYVGTVNFVALRDNPLLKDLLVQSDEGTNAWEELHDEFGVDPERIERLTFAAISDDPLSENDDENDAPYVMVLDLDQPGLAPAVLKKLQTSSPQPWELSDKGHVQLHIRRAPKPLAFYFADERTMVCGTPDLVQSVLSRGRPANVSAQLTSACQQLDTSQLMSVAAALPDEIRSSPAAKVFPADVLEGMQSILIHVDGRSRLHVRCTVVCRDELIAYQLKGMYAACWMFVQMIVEQAGDIEPEGVEFLDSFEYAVSDGHFVVQCAIPASVLGQSSIDGSAVESLGTIDVTKLFSCEIPLGCQVAPCIPSGPVYGTPVPPPTASSVYPSLPAPKPVAEAPVPIITPEVPEPPDVTSTADSAPVIEPTEEAPIRIPNDPGPPVAAQPPGFDPYSTIDNPYSQVVPAQRVAPPTHMLSDHGVIRVAPAASPEPAPPSPYPPNQKAPVTSTENAVDSLRTQLDATQQELRNMRLRYQRYEQRLHLAEQDRDLLEQRFELYRTQLQRCQEELDLPDNQPTVQPGEPSAPPSLYQPGKPRLSTPQNQPGGQASLDLGKPVRLQPTQDLIFTDENLGLLLDEWERYWFLDQPDHAVPFRVHGGVR